MNLKIAVLAVFLFFPAFVIAVSDLSGVESLVVDSKINSFTGIASTGGPVEMEYLYLNYTWFPIEDYRQDLLFIQTDPPSQKNEGSMFFDIRNLKEFQMQISFRTKTTSDPVIIKKKVKFPLNRLDQELVRYTQSSELVDINPEIRSLASQIAGDEDDMYVVVFKIADWVNTNIEYNLSTLTSEATLPSSWVLRERQGVCDELSNLFVSMVRSLGIPARVVSGIAHTDSELFDYEWGAHGWAEVYFPGHGWVPFDPTYNQLGYVDATHIKMKEQVGDERFNSQYVWKGKGFIVEPGQQQIESKVIFEGNQRQADVDISVSFLKSEVGFGSYNVVVASLKNKKDYYVSRVLDLSRTQGIQIIGEPVRDVILKPYENKQVYWIVEVEDSLDSGFIYTFPVSVFTQIEKGGISGFKAVEGGAQITIDAARRYNDDFNGKAVEGLSCTPSESYVYANENFSVKCKFGPEHESKRVKMCVDEKCTDNFVTEGYSSVDVELGLVGYTTFLVSAISENFAARSFVSVNVIDPASIEIRNLSFPENIKYGQKKDISFIIQRNSTSIPKNISVIVSHKLFENEWNVSELPGGQGFVLSISGKDLLTKKNFFNIYVGYTDDKGRYYSNLEEIEVDIEGLKIWERFMMWFNDLRGYFK